MKNPEVKAKEIPVCLQMQSSTDLMDNLASRSVLYDAA